MVESKRCNKCYRALSLDNFYSRAESVDGKRNDCKDCGRQSRRIYTQKPEIRERCRLYSQTFLAKGNNREKRNKYGREFHAKHRGRANEIYRANYDKYRVRRKARRQLQHKVRIGEIIRGACVICGNPKTEGHHEDYSKPFDVRWLCSKHHGEQHRKYKVENGRAVLR